MQTIHLTLQGKGGVGKTFISSLNAQFLKDQGLNPICIDTDPVNTTFSSYKALEVTTLDLLTQNEINPRKFDQLVTEFIENDSPFVVDSGAATFLPLSNYLVENGISDLLKEHKRQLIIHTVITGGMALRDTLTGLVKLGDNLPNSAQLVVWLNPYFGEIEAQSKPFEQMKAYLDYKDRIQSIIRIPQKQASTYGKDIEEMLRDRLTFAEAIQRPECHLLSKQRLAMYQREVNQQLQPLTLVGV